MALMLLAAVRCCIAPRARASTGEEGGQVLDGAVCGNRRGALVAQRFDGPARGFHVDAYGRGLQVRVGGGELGCERVEIDLVDAGGRVEGGRVEQAAAANAVARHGGGRGAREVACVREERGQVDQGGAAAARRAGLGDRGGHRAGFFLGVGAG
jgi:hypothetical protein